MTVTVDGTLGVTAPKLTLGGTGTNILLPSTTAGTYTQTLPDGDGILLLTQVIMNFPTTLGNSGDTLVTDGSGTLSWTPAGGAGTVTSVSGATVAGMGLSFTGTVTSSGSITLGGTLNPSNGGTGLTALGTGVQTALGNATNAAAGFPVLDGSGAVAPAQGGTGLTALGSGVQTALGNAADGANGFALLNGSGLIPTTKGGTGLAALGTGVQAALGNATNGANGLPTLDGTGALPAAQGGTGLTALGSGVSAALSNATNSANGFPTLNGSGIVPIAQGGTGLSAAGASGTTLVSNGSIYAAGYPDQATNITGGNAWEVPYQTATDTTGFVSAGVTGEVLSANTGAAPTWITGDVTIGTTAIALGGTATVFSGVQTINLTQDPTSGLQASTKQYVDAKTSGLQDIGIAKAASTGNLTLSGTQTVDGVSLVATDICLVKDQGDPTKNGLYEVQAGPWTYASSANTWSDYPSAVVFVSSGTTNANTSWIQTNLNPAGTLGGTAQSWVIQSSPVTSYSAGTGIDIAVNVISNTGVISFDGGSTGLTPTGAATGAISLGGTLAIGFGGTGRTSLGTGVQTALGNNINTAGGFAVLDVSGILPIAQGGTGASSVSGAQANLLPTQTGNPNKFLLTDGSGNLSWQAVSLKVATTAITSGNSDSILIENSSHVLDEIIMGSGVSGALAIGTNTNGGFILAGAGGSVPIAQGGTGATSLSGAQANLLPAQAGNPAKFLQTDGSGNLSWAAAGTVTSVDIGITAGMGLTATGGPITSSGTITLGGTLSVANGGTGATSAAAAAAALLPTQAGNSGKVLSTDGLGALSWVNVGGTGTVTSVSLDPASTGLTVNGGTSAVAITGSGTFTLGGTLSTANGGTGLNSLGTAGQVLTVNPGATALIWSSPTNAITLGTTTVTGTSGDLLYNNAGVVGGVSLGSAGQVLTVNGGATAAVWAALPNVITIGTTTVSGGSTGNLLYNNGGSVGAFALGTNVSTALGNATNAAGGFSVLNGSGLVSIAQGGTGLAAAGASGTTLVSDGTNYAAGYPARATNISGGNPWEVMYQSAANTTGFVAAGTTGQILTANTGAAPTWGSGSVTVGTTAIALGGSATVLSGVTTLNLTQDPTSGLEAATKQYVDAKTAGLQDIGVAKAATTGNITRSGPQTIDTISLVAGDICLVKNQTTASENGLYEVQAAAWTYASTAASWADYPSAVVFVQQGATNANTSWIQTNLNPAGIIGTTDQTWVIQSSPVTSYSAGNGINISVNQISNTGVLSVSGGSTGLTFDNSTGTCALQGTLAATNGGTGLTGLGSGVSSALANNAGGNNGFALLNASGVLPVAQGGTGISSLGTGVASALGNNVNSANGLVAYNGTLGTSTQIAGSTSGTVTLQAQPTASGTLTLPNGSATILASSSALTSGSVVFAGASGVISENNAAFFWDNTNKALKIGTASTASGIISLFNSLSAHSVSIASGNNSAAWTMTLPTSAGTNGQVLTTNGSGVTSWVTSSSSSVVPKWVSTATTAVAGDEIWVDSSAAAVTITLPATPTTGDVVTVNRIGANNVTVARNGSTILGSATDFVINVDHNGGRFVYLNSTWQVQKTQLGA